MKKNNTNKTVISHLMGNPCGNKASFCGHTSAGSPVKRGMTAEGGRSMVEMLGVLAIIGVISIGAIAGYTYGMNRYRTNEILDGANKRAYTISTQDSLGIPYNLSEYRDYNVTAGGTFASTIQDWDGEFGLTITGVSKDVCENLIRMMGDKSTLRAITKTSDEKTDLASGDCASPTNDLYLVYNKDMAADDATNSGRSGNTTLVGGYCTEHPDACTETCGNYKCAKFDGDWKTYDEAVAQCGGEENMFTAEELGCTSFESSCTNAPSDGDYWIAGDVDIDQMVSDYGYSSTQALLDDYGYSSVQEFKSTHALYVNYGNLFNASRDGDYSLLCK